MKYSGTISRGVRTPIIKMGDDLASIVVDSVGKCIEEANIELQDKDVIAITEAVVGISQGNYPFHLKVQTRRHHFLLNHFQQRKFSYHLLI